MNDTLLEALEPFVTEVLLRPGEMHPRLVALVDAFLDAKMRKAP